MNYYTCLAIVLSVVSCAQFFVGADSVDGDLGSIILAHAIFRHGDRTPIDPYPLDPYRNLSYWPVGWGQLTNRGKVQHFELGQWFRKRYAEMLPANYSKEDILVRSTDVDRTLMSAASNLAGLYLPGPSQEWNKDVKWQPIPIHTVPEHMDEVLAGKKPCPRYDSELRKVKDSPEMRKINKDNAELFKYLALHTGKEVNDIQGLEFIYNTLFIENLNQMVLPEWTRTVFPDKMSGLAGLTFSVPAMTRELQRLKSGPLLADIVQHMERKASGKLSPDRKLFVYSGHDITVANLLMTLGVFDMQSPPYTATVMLELRKSPQGKHVVTLWYRNSTSREPYLLAIPGCSALCPLGQFVSLTADRIPGDWQGECLNTMVLFTAEGLAFNPVALIGLIVSGVVAILLVTCLALGVLHWRQQKLTTYNYHRLPSTHNVI